MALEESGVSLKVQNFESYIKRLDRIDKKQQDIFNVVSQRTGKTYDEVAKAAKRYEKELRDLANAERKAEAGARKLAAAQKAAAAANQTAALAGASAAIFLTKEIVEQTIELSKLGAQYKAQRAGLNNLAASFGQTGSAIQSSIQRGSQGAISGLKALEIANTGLLLGVAKTPSEFERIAKVATTLGRALGLSAEQSIERFTTGLGRQSKLIIDDLGISTSSLDAEIERIAQRDFGKFNRNLTQAEQAATFTAAALSLGEEKIKALGEGAGEAQASFERLAATSENLQVTIGTLLEPLGTGISNELSDAGKTAQQFFSFVGAGMSATGAIITGELGNIVSFFKGEATKSFDEILDEAGVAAIDRFKDIASTVEGVDFPNEDAKQFTNEINNQADAFKLSEDAVKAYESALKQAQSLQLSFAREAEDVARKQTRALEDTARKLARSSADVERKANKDILKLRESQAEDSDKLLQNQAKQLDKFEKNRRKQITDAEEKIRDAQKEAAEDRKRDQEKLQRDLQRAREKFNLDQLQGERRFRLQERRLIAEGDILGIQQLREDNELRKQEEKENFALSEKEQIKSAAEKEKEQGKDLEKQLKELKINLEDQRAELLTSFDEQLQAQKEAQAKAIAQQQADFAEQAAERQIALAREEEDRAIALSREEEDRRISQRRQLEDLGQSLADQKDVTAQGVNAIAGEIERVFGLEGAATNIITGFSSRTRNEFEKMLDDVEGTFKRLTEEKEKQQDIPLVSLTGNTGLRRGGGFGERRAASGIQAFDEGGVVPGPIGAPQPAIVHGGETILPTHQRSFQMPAPVVPSQRIDHVASGAFNVTVNGQANDEIMNQVATEITQNFRIAVERIARKS